MQKKTFAKVVITPKNAKFRIKSRNRKFSKKVTTVIKPKTTNFFKRQFFTKNRHGKGKPNMKRKDFVVVSHKIRRDIA